MKKYEFNATNRIAEAFEAHEVKYRVVNMHGQEEVQAGFPVDNGPLVIMKFISTDNDNDIGVRVYGLLRDIPEEKHNQVLRACNSLNRKVRYLKFDLDDDGDVNAEYDFLQKSGDANIGEMAFEIFVRAMSILDHEYADTFKEFESGKQQPSLDDLDELIKRLEAHLKLRESSDTEEDEHVELGADGEDENAAFLARLAQDMDVA